VIFRWFFKAWPIREGRGRLLFLILTATMLPAACAPVIETATYPLSMAAAPAEPSGGCIVLDPARIEKTAEAPDLIELKKKLEEVLNSLGLVRDVRVGPAGSCGQAAYAEVALTRLEYTKKALRLPPPAPLGIAILYPLMLPVLMHRDFIRLEIIVQADLLFHGGEGHLTKQLFLSETSTARANFFNSGEEGAVERLREIAFHNFSIQLLSEFF
jgi:hypothetical protein